ncbi:hypothetical protein PR048_021770 [Dryococelus australis]|uniref:PiggyBac transposable element-derived protein domain-containing protein n=1 Tax=Dryococelus australis TaxID=614101 RepID=A0ABQ9GZ73_9NEOP|nr:hypothetical protein PR048_021770 [Dryococelus australis]
MSKIKKKTWKASELTHDDVEMLLVEIPTAIGSTSDENESPENVCSVNDNIDAVLQDTEVSTNQVQSSDDEDDTSLIKRLYPDHIVWSHKRNTTQKIHFGEHTEPLLPENAKMPVDIFLLHFPEELIEKIVFETNLYATQKHGGINIAATTSRN